MGTYKTVRQRLDDLEGVIKSEGEIRFKELKEVIRNNDIVKMETYGGIYYCVKNYEFEIFGNKYFCEYDHAPVLILNQKQLKELFEICKISIDKGVNI